MATFGRYAFNKPHAIAYCLWAFWCLWFKAHYREEYWATVHGRCPRQQLERYLSAARAEGTLLTPLCINHLTVYPTALSGRTARNKPSVAFGLVNLKNVGLALAKKYVTDDQYKDVDDFVNRVGGSKIILERLIKLGAFRELHPHIKATWFWYLYKYGSGKIDKRDRLGAEQVRDLRVQVHEALLAADGWTIKAVEAERARQVAEFRKLYPKRQIIPKKIANWQPQPIISRDRVMALCTTDFSATELLGFEKAFLGFYWTSPRTLFRTGQGKTFAVARTCVRAVVEAVVLRAEAARTKNGTDMLRLVMNDGVEDCLVIAWQSEYHAFRELLAVSRGLRLKVDYDETRKSFTIARGSEVSPLLTEEYWAQMVSEP
jgi:DNA polymerase III alpha subunit